MNIKITKKNNISKLWVLVSVYFLFILDTYYFIERCIGSTYLIKGIG